MMTNIDNLVSNLEHLEVQLKYNTSQEEQRKYSSIVKGDIEDMLSKKIIIDKKTIRIMNKMLSYVLDVVPIKLVSKLLNDMDKYYEHDCECGGCCEL